MKKKLLSFVMVGAASVVFSGMALAHCGKCGAEGEHAHGDKKQCSVSGDKKQCSVNKGEKGCAHDCKKSCCYKAKTNFGPRKR